MILFTNLFINSQRWAVESHKQNYQSFFKELFKTGIKTEINQNPFKPMIIGVVEANPEITEFFKLNMSFEYEIFAKAETILLWRKDLIKINFKEINYESVQKINPIKMNNEHGCITVSGELINSKFSKFVYSCAHWPHARLFLERELTAQMQLNNILKFLDQNSEDNIAEVVGDTNLIKFEEVDKTYKLFALKGFIPVTNELGDTFDMGKVESYSWVHRLLRAMSGFKWFVNFIAPNRNLDKSFIRIPTGLSIQVKAEALIEPVISDHKVILTHYMG